MRAVIFEGVGSADVLQMVNVPIPEVRPQDLLIRVHAAGVNRADILQREGVYGARPYFGDSYIPGLEMAGEVVDVGEDAKGFAVGDRVMAIVGGGGYAEYARVDYRMCMVVHGGMPYHQAAAIPEAFVTAHEALIHLGVFEAGRWALVHAAAGGVGSATVQLVRASGGHSVFTASGGPRIERVKSLGGTIGVDYRHQDFLPVVQEATAGVGVDVVVDFIGAPYLERNLLALSPGGRLIQVGALGGTEGSLPIGLLIHQHLRIVGTVMKSRSLEEKIAMTARFRDRWAERFLSGLIEPVVDRVFPLEDAADAHRYMEASGNVGKIILAVL